MARSVIVITPRQCVNMHNSTGVVEPVVLRERVRWTVDFAHPSREQPKRGIRRQREEAQVCGGLLRVVMRERHPRGPSWRQSIAHRTEQLLVL
jgi:hypothetical protein